MKLYRQGVEAGRLAEIHYVRQKEPGGLGHAVWCERKFIGDEPFAVTDALRSLARERPMYAYVFEGRRYDVGDRLGFLQATVEFALKREDLREPFREYLEGLMRRLPGVLEHGA